MKKLLIILMFVLISFGSTGIVRAEDPYVHVSVEKEKLILKTILAADTKIPEALTVKVKSNCFHGPIVASLNDLKHRRGDLIKPERVCIKTDVTSGYISMEKPVVISAPTTGSHDIVVDFEIKANTQGVLDYAGRYSGTLTFTILPPV
jgi:hypothetical protein